ncbi:hypothetical protein BT63DRAFT_382200 [Microthyrium microscopicum]|uniref:Formin GTPase-binding domain-containing protein n=1 Tax=Microthyrium microscopicum TaxID=703497 RepID=A0A6A6USS9_9PEZI|nr:hypothetical protein BT63DRAFT_382200 [Microthyrium microscopicum]
MDFASKAGFRPQGHKRNKSSTSIFKSIIPNSSSKAPVKGKENTTPPSTANSSTPPLSTPIWSELSTAIRPANQRPKSQLIPASKIPLNDRTVEQEINLYTPRDYSPSKQRTFDTERPTLGRRERPKSSVLERSQSSMTVFEALNRKATGENVQERSKSTQAVHPTTNTSKVPLKPEGGAEKVAKATRSASRDLFTMAKKGSRVMGLVAAFNGKSDDNSEKALDPKQIESAFEALLQSRNIPANMRSNLRSLKPSVKAELIKSNDIDFAAMSKSKSAPGSTKDKPVASGHVSDESLDTKTQTSEQKKFTKRSRARSKTFTFSKSGTKKAKGETPSDTHVSGKNVWLPKSSSTVSLSRPSMDGGKSATPEEFVTYLRSEQKPQKVLVGKVHKLRQLLRNETVTWVESFVKMGGMMEIVDLLHRIMEVEWREDHEDQLLHETLLCLKALCTTDSALQKLCDIEKTLFPALLSMLFDPEHKGPSEFTTRGIVINILVAHLNACSKDQKALYARAKDILSYVSDPMPPEDKRPVPFILEMHQARPYKVWHREVSNVTKEVFWIFLHNLNVVALPAHVKGATKDFDVSKLETDLSAQEYLDLYFPRPRPPVPAAPYVGGVEWDATNYVAGHLDLMNGLIAALPTKQERNELRREMQASGWEKVMGSTLRTCKEKFYDCVHDGLRTWVAAAVADGWPVRDVRMGPRMETYASPKRSPMKKQEAPPVLDAPNFDLKLGFDELHKPMSRSAKVEQWL